MAGRRYGGLVLVSVLAVGTPWGAAATAQQPAAHRELSQVLERADVSPESRALLRQKALDAVRVGVAERDVADLVQRSVGRNVQTPDLVHLLDVVTQAKRQDLPAGPVLDKVREGLAKRVPAERIGSVASHLAGTLATARDLVRRAERGGVRVAAPAERERAIEAVADALGRGVPSHAIEELSQPIAGAPPERATMSRLEAGAQVTADLVAMKVSPRDAAATVGAALAQGFGVREVARLRERLAQELRRGRAPDEGARRLRDELRTERPEERPDGSQEKGPGRDREWRDRESPGGGRPGRH